MHACQSSILYLHWLFVMSIWPLKLKCDIDTVKICSFVRYTCMPNIKSISLLEQKLSPKLYIWLWPRRLTWWKVMTKIYIWPLISKDDLGVIMSPFNVCGLMRYTCMPNIKSLLDEKLWPILKSVIWPLYLTFDIEGWHWPWKVTT